MRQAVSFERKGSGRPLVVMHAGLAQDVIDELATRFDVYAIAVSEGDEAEVKRGLEAARVERPLLFGHGAGVTVACAVAGKRIPRGMVLCSEPREAVAVPLLVVTDTELIEVGRLVERVAAFDAPLQ